MPVWFAQKSENATDEAFARENKEINEVGRPPAQRGYVRARSEVVNPRGLEEISRCKSLRPSAVGEAFTPVQRGPEKPGQPKG